MPGGRFSNRCSVRILRARNTIRTRLPLMGGGRLYLAHVTRITCDKAEVSSTDGISGLCRLCRPTCVLLSLSRMFSVFSTCHGGKVNSKTAPNPNAFLTFVPILLFQFCLRAPDIFERVAISPFWKWAGVSGAPRASDRRFDFEDPGQSIREWRYPPRNGGVGSGAGSSCVKHAPRVVSIGAP
jgi:hypothetical protein